MESSACFALFFFYGLCIDWLYTYIYIHVADAILRTSHSFLASILYADPWHMITSFPQYMGSFPFFFSSEWVTRGMCMRVCAVGTDVVPIPFDLV